MGDADQDELNAGVLNTLHGVGRPSMFPTLDKEKKNNQVDLI